MTAKFLASGLGSLCVALVICVLDPRGRRRAGAFLLVVAAAAGTAAVAKGLVGRERPSHLDQTAGEERRWSFHGPVVGIPNAPFQSFPSGHTASAFAAATVLAAYYPPARVVFFVVAGGTAVNRVVKHQHFISDVVAGIMLGHLVALWLLHRPRIRRLWWSEAVDSGGPPA
jgi:membrane-associated phospholipid phosphatase